MALQDAHCPQASPSASGEAVDGFGEDARAGCLAHSTRTAKQICLSQTSGLNRILQRGCQILLTDLRCGKWPGGISAH